MPLKCLNGDVLKALNFLVLKKRPPQYIHHFCLIFNIFRKKMKKICGNVWWFNLYSYF